MSNGRPQVEWRRATDRIVLEHRSVSDSSEGGTWLDLVRETFQAERELLPNRRCPLSEIQQWAGGQPLFETVFDFVQFHVYRDLPGYQENSFLEDHYFEANNFAYYQTFMLDASGSELQMHCDYDPNVLCEPQVRALGEYYAKTLAEIAAAPRSALRALVTHAPLGAGPTRPGMEPDRAGVSCGARRARVDCGPGRAHARMRSQRSSRTNAAPTRS